MFSLNNDWDEDGEGGTGKQAKEVLPKDPGAGGKAKNKKSKSASLALTKLTRMADAVAHSPGMTRGLLDDDDDEDDPSGQDAVLHKAKKKKKKKKSKREKSAEESPGTSEGGQAGAKMKKSSSASSLAEAAVTSAGSILRKGIKFANLQDFCSFMDGGSGDKKKKKDAKKRKSSSSSSPDVNGGGDETPPDKKPKFDKVRIKCMLNDADEQEEQDKKKSLQETPSSKAKTKLESSRFRYLNELLYTQPGAQSNKMFRSDRESFRVYHRGYMEQAARWPTDPLQVVIASVMKASGSPVVADFGCGEARLARALPSHQVHSFDFVALNDRVTECDMANTPLDDSSVDIAVFCLSLMGTNLRDYLREANRVLKEGGTLKVAEVESRFKDLTVDDFASAVSKFGFELKSKDVAQKFFVYLDFRKTGKAKKKKAPKELQLNPCWYKKR